MTQELSDVLQQLGASMYQQAAEAPDAGTDEKKDEPVSPRQ